MFLTTKWSPGPEATSPGRPPVLHSSFVRNFLIFALLLSIGMLTYALTHSILALVAMLVIGAAALAWHIGVTASTGVFLLLIPCQWLVIALLQFWGVAQYKQISETKEAILIAAIVWFFYHAPRLRFTAPDIILGATLLFVAFEQLFYTDPKGLRDDWEWALPYVLGRLLTLSPATQARWAKCAVWMCAVLAIIGAWEVEFLGSAPRLLLLRVSEGDTQLPVAFLANGYAGFRAASTMASPLAFSALCMVALVLWWTYMKNPIPAALIGVGLVLTLTRSAAATTILGVLIIAIRRGERKRSAFFVALAVLSILIAIPALNLAHYVDFTLTPAADTSTMGHRNSVIEGFDEMLDFPLGLGAGTVSPRNIAINANAPEIEDSFLVIAIEYGIAVGALYVAFVVSCLWCLFRLRESIGYAAFSIMLGFGLLLSIGALHLDIPLACWVWVPVGMAVSRAAEVSRIGSLQLATS